MAVCDKLLINATTMNRFGEQQENQAIAISGEKIAWCGSAEDLPGYYVRSATEVNNCEGNLITPGLIDCHTHLVYGGNRAEEFKARLEGVSYTEIARRGGGILSTVRATRAASEEELTLQSLPRLWALHAEGVTTVEIKSGYGLDLENELKMLRAARRLGEMTGIRVKTTFLGAHVIAPEYKNRGQAYVDYLCQEMMPAVAESGLADAVDVFCESIAFSVAQTEQLFNCAQTLSLPVKCHADQLSNLGATKLAANFSALSCDHLEYLDKEGAAAMAKANTVAVLLPGAFYFLRETQKPPIDLLRGAGVGMAVATDCNPGTSPTTSLLLIMNMACQFFNMTVPEVLSAVTYQAAKALGLADEIGAIEKGLSADLLLWSINDSAQLCYHFGYHFPHATMIAGKWMSS